MSLVFLNVLIVFAVIFANFMLLFSVEAEENGEKLFYSAFRVGAYSLALALFVGLLMLI